MTVTCACLPVLYLLAKQLKNGLTFIVSGESRYVDYGSKNISMVLAFGDTSQSEVSAHCNCMASHRLMINEGFTP